VHTRTKAVRSNRAVDRAHASTIARTPGAIARPEGRRAARGTSRGPERDRAAPGAIARPEDVAGE